MRPKQFVQNPPTIEAMRFTDHQSYVEILDWMRERRTDTRHCQFLMAGAHKRPIMKLVTVDGSAMLMSGEWVICNEAGQYSSLSDEVLKKRYSALA